MKLSPPYEIKLMKGFADLPFGSQPSMAVELFGEPEDKEEIKEDLLNDHSLVYHYWELGFSLFFNCNNNFAFSCAEIDANGLLFNKPVFNLNEKDILELFSKNGYKASETEMQEWGEKRISFDEIQLDLYFQNNKLSSINFGLFPEDSGYIYFPN